MKMTRRAVKHDYTRAGEMRGPGSLPHEGRLVEDYELNELNEI